MLLKKYKLLRKVLSEFHLASGEEAKGKLRQIYEIAQLVFRGQYTPDEYYTYRFFEKDRTYSNMLNYMSKYHSLEYYHPTMRDPGLSFIINNKFYFNAFYRHHALPVTNIYGLFCEECNFHSDGFLLKTEDELKEMLFRQKPENLVIKTVTGTQGKSIVILRGGKYKDGDITFYKKDGKIIALPELIMLARTLSNLSRTPGVLIEEKLFQHDLLNKINRSSVNTVRVITQLNKNGKAIVCLAVLRIGRKGSDIDNVSQGGLFAGLNLQDGEIGLGSFNTKFDLDFYMSHPDSGIKFSGLKIPYWEKTKALCTKAAELAPFCRSIGWDVAVTPQGPVLIEGNNYWSMALQARSNGFLSPEVRDILAEYGLKFPKGNLPGVRFHDLQKAVSRWIR